MIEEKHISFHVVTNNLTQNKNKRKKKQLCIFCICFFRGSFVFNECKWSINDFLSSFLLYDLTDK